MNINLQLAQEFNLKQNYADNIVSLIEEGNTIPFIARYRKEMHGGCDDALLPEQPESPSRKVRSIIGANFTSFFIFIDLTFS